MRMRVWMVCLSIAFLLGAGAPRPPSYLELSNFLLIDGSGAPPRDHWNRLVRAPA